MKEPREILLNQHQGAVPQLERIRKSTLAKLRSPADSHPSTVYDAIFARWASWLFPLRRQLVGLGIAWILIAALNLSNTSGHRSPETKLDHLSPRQVWLALREHQRQLREWIAPAPPKNPNPSKGPQTFAPPPTIPLAPAEADQV